MKFIHTFSLERISERDEIDALKSSYKAKEFLYNSWKKAWVLIPYTNSGLTVEIEPIPNDSGKRRFDKRHPLFSMILRVTPAKLLNPEINLGGLTSKEDIDKACERLKGLAHIIEDKSGIDILSEIYLSRVDVTKDCITPSNLYSHEIIAALKKALDKRGYKRYNPKIHDNYNMIWGDEDSFLFHNDNQHVGGKVYNKKRDLILNRHCEDAERLGKRGLLRFEISLLYPKLRNDYAAGGTMTCERLSEVLWSITSDAGSIFFYYFSEVMIPGAMVSRKVMKAYIKRNYVRRDITQKKMMTYSDSISEKKRRKEEFSDSEIETRKKWFEAIGLSPVSVSRKCPYIPSIADLLEDRTDTELLQFAKNKTAQDDLLYWDSTSRNNPYLTGNQEYYRLESLS